MNLQKEIQSVKKEIETKDNKINLLTMNNKILQGKVNKLSQTTKNGFNTNNEPNNNINTNTNTDINNIFNLNNKEIRSTLINPKKSDIISDSRKCFIVAKPKKSAHLISNNGRQNSTNIRVKSDIIGANINKQNIIEENNLNNLLNKNNNKILNTRKGQKVSNSNINKRNNNIVPVNKISNMNSNNIGNNINININNINYINDKETILNINEKKEKENKENININQEIKKEENKTVINNKCIKIFTRKKKNSS